jgi:hypothetical protein
MAERRTIPRKKFGYYLRILDDDTQEILGHMVECSETGFQLDTTVPHPTEKDYYLRVELTPDLADRPFIIFIGRTIWCKMDEIEPNLYHVGFKMMEIMPDDNEIFLTILKKFSK